MDFLLSSWLALLVVAIIVALVARRLSLPYTVGLVATGAGLTLAHFDLGLTLTHDFIYLLILPPLLFEAAFGLHWRELRRDLVPVLVLSTVGVCISAAVVAAGLVWLLGWAAGPALVFGVLIAATDPVAVIALFKDLRLTGRLRLLVESESLFNDGVAAVLFGLVLTWALAPDSGALDATGVLLALLRTVGGGIAIGLGTGAAALVLAGRTHDYVVSAAVTTAAAYGSFVLANRLGFSGVLATVVAGMLIGNVGVLEEAKVRFFSPPERGFVQGFWSFAAFIANSFVFLLIGLSTASVPFAGLGAQTILAIILLVQIGRILTVYPLCLPFAGSRWAIPLRDQHVLWWSGLRGALGLALALSLPRELPMAGEIRVAAFAVVAFSVIVQGLTMPLLLRRLGVVA